VSLGMDRGQGGDGAMEGMWVKEKTFLGDNTFPKEKM